jgi:antitoxin YefM
MDTVSYPTACFGLGIVMDKVCREGKPVVIRRRGNRSVVMLPLSEYRSMEETNYLLGTRKNALRLLEGIQEIES